MSAQLQMFEEQKNSEGFDSYRNSLKALLYFYSQIIEREVYEEQSNKYKIDTKKGWAKRKTKVEWVNFIDSLHMLGRIVNMDLNYLWKSRRIEPEVVSMFSNVGFNMLEVIKKREEDMLNSIFDMLETSISKFGANLGDDSTET